MEQQANTPEHYQGMASLGVLVDLYVGLKASVLITCHFLARDLHTPRSPTPSYPYPFS